MSNLQPSAPAFAPDVVSGFTTDLAKTNDLLASAAIGGVIAGGAGYVLKENSFMQPWVRTVMASLSMGYYFPHKDDIQLSAMVGGAVFVVCGVFDKGFSTNNMTSCAKYGAIAGASHLLATRYVLPQFKESRVG